MTTKTRTIDQLVKLSTKVAEAWIKKPSNIGNALTHKAILAVCKHLSHEASYRSDIAELVRLCQSATEEQMHEKSKATAQSHTPALPNIELTPRQLEILQLFARGLSYKEVGIQLNVSTPTIKNHASAIYERLGVKNKAEAIFEAREIGIAIC